MILNIKHQTTYNFYSSVPRLVQSLKLYPSNCKNQKVIKWNISASMGQLCKSHQDALGHTIYNIYSESIIGEQTIVSEGKINTIFKNYKIGSILNTEIDILAKYIEKLGNKE